MGPSAASPPLISSDGQADYICQFTFLVEPYAVSCEDVEVYYTMDFNQDCYVDIEDFAQFAQDWLKCNDPTDEYCTPIE